MSNMLRTGLIFAAGLLIGALADQLLMKKKFDERLDKEIEAVKTYKSETKGEDRRTPFGKFVDAMDSVGSTAPVSHKEAKVTAIKKATAPYAITAEDFGEEEGYNSLSLYYYTEDEILTDEADNEIDDVDEILGEGALDIFVYTDADRCFIRNDEKRCDYEVIKHEGSFADYDYPARSMEDEDE